MNELEEHVTNIENKIERQEVEIIGLKEIIKKLLLYAEHPTGCEALSNTVGPAGCNCGIEEGYRALGMGITIVRKDGNGGT